MFDISTQSDFLQLLNYRGPSDHRADESRQFCPNDSDVMRFPNRSCSTILVKHLFFSKAHSTCNAIFFLKFKHYIAHNVPWILLLLTKIQQKKTSKAELANTDRLEHELCACFVRLPSGLQLSSAPCPSLTCISIENINGVKYSCTSGKLK